LAAIAAAWLASPAFGQDAPDAPVKVLVTGSNIPATARESALPVQVITREEIERTNLRTAAELVTSISATMSYSGFNEVQGVGGAGQAGFAGGAMRGLGFQFTLVLVNGRRVAHFAFVPRGGDLNAIPLAAVERVEVLKDGASAIYGSDAIGGVINFILRSDYRGAELYAQYGSPEETGGYSKQLTAGGGIGDLATDGFNASLTVDAMKSGGIRARDRAFAARNYIPEEGLDQTVLASIPANVDTPVGIRNPTGDPANGYRNPSCASPLSFPTAGPANQYQCRWSGDGTTSIVNPSERLNLAGALTVKLDGDHRLFVNGTYSRNRMEFVGSPAEVSSQLSFGQINGFRLPPTSAYYPRDFAHTFGLDGALNVHWSAFELGPRTVVADTEQWNVVAGARGTVLGWSYDGALNYSRSEAEQSSAGGYLRESAIFPIVNSGVVDPFGRNTQDVLDLLSTAQYLGVLRTGRSTTTSVDLRASKEIYTLPAGEVALAVGFDVRREELVHASAPALASGDILNLGATPSLAGSRDIRAVFAEANVPLLRSLEANVAVRYDHYSDFGSTTNPKLALRWQPAQALVLRGSVGTGFLAPGLSGLYLPPVAGFTASRLNDPARCPVTNSPLDCNRRFPSLSGGNPDLQPVESAQWTLGTVWAPTSELSMGIDYIAIQLDDRINVFFPQQLLAQCPDGATGPSCSRIRRGSVDQAYPTLPGPIDEIDLRLSNLGKARVSALDFSLQYRPTGQSWGRVRVDFTGTYTIEHKQQQLDGSYVDQVNRYSVSGGFPGIVPRWRHRLVLDFSRGPWSATLDETFQTGGYDQPPLPGSGQQQRVVGEYDLWNLRVAYAGFPGWTLAAGIRNLFDRDPPFSVQTQSAQVGYDPSYADPHGRLYWAGVRFAFR